MITFLGLSAALDLTYLVDHLRPGAIHRPGGVLAQPGGKAFNAARAAKTLGATPRVLAPTGGFTGMRVRAALTELDLDAPEISSDTETRLCVTVFDDGDAPTEFYEVAPAIPDGTWRAVVEGVEGVDGVGGGWLAVSGSIPGARIADVAALIAGAGARGIRIALDTHGPALATLLDATRPALVKINRSEAEELLGAGDAATLAGRLAERTHGVAVVTDGAEGASAAVGDDVWRAVPPAAGRFAVGSGDCFLAGLLVGLDAVPGTGEALAYALPKALADALPGALRLATAAAAANTLEPGAALFTIADVHRLAGDVRVTRTDARVA